MRPLKRIAAGILIGLATIGTASARDLTMTGSGFVEIDLPGYAASSSFSYTARIPPWLLPNHIAPITHFTVNGVQSIGPSRAALNKDGTLGYFQAFGPFEWYLMSEFGEMAFRANGVSCGFPQDAGKPECAGNHRWGWESTPATFVAEPAAFGLAALGLLVLGASTSRRR